MAVVSGTIMALKLLGKQALKAVTKKAITGSVKKAVKGKIKDKIKDKIKSKFKKKKVKGKDIAQKMFGGGERKKKWEQAIEYTKNLDEIRKQNIKDYLPEFTEYF